MEQAFPRAWNILSKSLQSRPPNSLAASYTYKGYGLEQDLLESDRLESWSDQLDSDNFESDEDESDEDENGSPQDDESGDTDESDKKKMQELDIARWRKKISSRASHVAGKERELQLHRITRVRNALEYTNPSPMEVYCYSRLRASMRKSILSVSEILLLFLQR